MFRWIKGLQRHADDGREEPRTMAVPVVEGLARDETPLEQSSRPRRVSQVQDVLVRGGSNLHFEVVGGGEVGQANIEDLDAPIDAVFDVRDLEPLIRVLKALRQNSALNAETAWMPLETLSAVRSSCIEAIDAQAADKRTRIADRMERDWAMARERLDIDIAHLAAQVENLVPDLSGTSSRQEAPLVAWDGERRAGGGAPLSAKRTAALRFKAGR